MKKYKIMSTVVIIITILFINIGYTYAAKEDLEKEYTKKGQQAVDEFSKIFAKLNKDGELQLRIQD